MTLLLMNGGTGRHLEYEYRDRIFRNFIFTVYTERYKSQSSMISTAVICATLEKAIIQVQVTKSCKIPRTLLDRRKVTHKSDNSGERLKI
jgi:hypothetical protein